MSLEDDESTVSVLDYGLSDGINRDHATVMVVTSVQPCEDGDRPIGDQSANPRSDVLSLPRISAHPFD